MGGFTKDHYWEMRRLAYDYDYRLGNGIVTEPDTTDTPGGEWRWPDRVHDLGTREVATASCRRIGEVVADRAYDGCEVLVDSKDDGLSRWGKLGWHPDLFTSDWAKLTACSYRVRDRQRARQPA